MLFFFENGKCRQGRADRLRHDVQPPKLTGAYSDKFPLACAVHLTEDTELALETNEPRALLVHTALLSPKTTRSTQGVQVMNIKAAYRLEKVLPAAASSVGGRAPAAGALLSSWSCLTRPERKGARR